ncbi:hypothetical protein CEXT_704161 [Caerostris extrusa]|uniref:Secreted protein n=1 Tax=Caerostris extrusa TaxID=172846 RepID=A0AAV4W977_CAEEX|nr:hypothetical protein CEXT_704161 [Caerostris extrusa]
MDTILLIWGIVEHKNSCRLTTFAFFLCQCVPSTTMRLLDSDIEMNEILVKPEHLWYHNPDVLRTILCGVSILTPSEQVYN